MKRRGGSLLLVLSLFPAVQARAQLVDTSTVHRPTTGCSLAVYDLSREIKVRGTITKIEMRVTRDRISTEVLIESARGVVNVQVGYGPAANPENLGISTGQPVQVTGIVERFGARAVLLARILATPDRISILRNECGMPTRSTTRHLRGPDFGGPLMKTRYFQTGAKELPMDREYDLFEKFPDGSLLWRDVVLGHENAIHKLQELAAKTPNECYAMHLPTNVILASMNEHQSPLQPKVPNFSQPGT